MILWVALGADQQLTLFANSHRITLRRRLWKISQWQSERPTAVHGRQIESQGRRYEGHQDGADSEEGSGSEGEAVDTHFTLVQYNFSHPEPSRLAG
jgi:hypothetical protein